jgi:predicted permease
MTSLLIPLLTDLPHAARRLLRSPGITAIAVATLALALGAHVAIFGLVDALFLKPLPVDDPERLVSVHESRDGEGFHPLSYADFLEYRGAVETFEGLAAAYLGAPLDLRHQAESTPVSGAVVSESFFPVLGIEPELGRFFLPEEDAGPGRSPVTVISHRLWQRRFAGDERVLGATIALNGVGFTVIGVAPESARSLRSGTAVDVWIPTSMAAVGYRWCDPFDHDCTWINLVGRLAPGRTIEQARAELTGLSRRVRAAWAREHPSVDATERGVALAPFAAVHPGARDDSIRLAAILVAAVSLLVAVAGASLAGLLLARALGRRHEVAIRLAIGAPRGRVVSLFLAETLLLGLAGGLGGLFAAAWFQRLVVRFYSSGEPLELAIEPRTVAYTALLSVLTGLAIGALPGIQTARSGVTATLREGGRSEPGRSGALSLLVVVQVALSVVLLTGTGLLLESLDTVRRTGAFDPARVATLRLRPRLLGLDPARAQAFTREVVGRLEGVPGVRSVSLASQLPPGRGDLVEVARGEAGSRPDRAEDRRLEAATQPIAPSFFATLGLPMLAGRDFDERDRAGGEQVAIVNRGLAEALFPGGPAVGWSLRLSGADLRVVGVVDDARLHLDPEGAPIPQVYVAYWQDPSLVDARLVVATNGPAAPLAPTLREQVAAVDAAVPVTEVGDLSARLRLAFTPLRLAGRTLGATAALSLLLCALCLYGVLRLTVALRIRDVGIRMALGARRSQVVVLVVRDALALVGAGLLLGLAVSVAAGHGLERYLYDTSPTDPRPLVGALVTLALVAALAAWGPARRATRVDPVKVLRES